MTDRNLARKQAIREATGPPSINYGQPEYEGQVLMGDAESRDGMKWSDNITSKKLRFSMGKRRDVASMEAVYLEGSSSTTGTGAKTLVIDTKIPNLVDNLLGIGSILVNYSGSTWFFGSGLTYVYTSTSISVNENKITIGNLNTAGVYNYRILLWVKEGHSKLLEDKTTEV